MENRRSGVGRSRSEGRAGASSEINDSARNNGQENVIFRIETYVCCSYVLLRDPCPRYMNTTEGLRAS